MKFGAPRTTIRALLFALFTAITTSITNAQVVQTLHTFNYGDWPNSTLVEATDGNLYGTTSSISGGTAFRLALDGTFETLVSFRGTNGHQPRGLIQATDGNFYGTTFSGGAMQAGTLFRINTNGEFTLLTSLDGTNCAFPTAPLVQASDGYLYGATIGGGTNLRGTVFRTTLDGNITVLASFDTGACTANSQLVEGSDGYLYGTTDGGGDHIVGTIYRISKDGRFQTLGSLGGLAGSQPEAGVTFGPDGNIYGTTSFGGANGGGTVYRLTTEGVLTGMYSFSTTTPNLEGGLTVASDGHLYGITTGDDDPFTGRYGTIFVTTTNGGMIPLYSFKGTNGDGPVGNLIQARDGRLYGVTGGGYSAFGFDHDGTVFAMTLPPPETFVPPTITQQPVGAINYGLVKLTVGATGPSLTYQWQWNGTNIAGATDSAYTNFLGGTQSYSVVVSNPFGSVTSAVAALVLPYGDYNGLFYETNAINPSHAGYFTFSILREYISSAGRYEQTVTGTICIGGSSYPLKSELFDNTIHLTSAANGKPRDVTLDFRLVAGTDTIYITGAVTGKNWSSTVTGIRCMDKHQTFLYPGNYAANLIGASGNTTGPDFGSRAIINISSHGAITVTGQLADDAPIYQSSQISEDGTWPLYVPVYGSGGNINGCLLGWIGVTNTPNSFQGTLTWSKLPKTGRYYPNGFTNQLTIFGSRRQ